MIDKSDIYHNLKTGSDTDVYFSRINTDNKSADFGKIKTSNGIDKFPYLSRSTGNSLKPTTEFIESNELRKGGAESAPRPGNTSVDGSLDIELSPVTFDDNLAATFKNEWKRWTSDNDSAVNLEGDAVNDGCFLTRATGDEDTYNNDEKLGQRRLLKDGVAGHEDGLIIVPKGCVVHELTFGKKNIEYSVIKKYGGVEGEDLFHVFNRLAIGTVNLDSQIGSIVTGSFGFIGDTSSDIMTEDETRAHFGGQDHDDFEDGVTTGNSYIDSLPELSTSTDQFTTREGDMWINGKNITFAQSLSFNIDKNMDKKYALFVKNPIAKTSQKIAITADLSTYLVPESKDLYNLANKNKTFELLFAFEDKGYMNDSFKDEDKPEFIYLFQIFSAKAEDKDLSASGADDYSMSVPLRSFGERLCRVFRIALPKTRDVEFTPASTWTNAGTIKIRPNVAVTQADVTDMITDGKISVLDTIKAADGTQLDQQSITSGFTANADGTISVAEAAWTQTVTTGKTRDIQITMNGETFSKSFGDVEHVAPDPVTKSTIAVVVRNKKTEISWTDPSSLDLDHILIDVQTSDGKSVYSGTVPKGTQKYVVSLDDGDYFAEFVSVDENGNQSTPTVSDIFKVSKANLGSVSTLAADVSTAEQLTATWIDPSSDITGIELVLTGGASLVTETVAKDTETKTFTSLTAGDYTVEATPYKAYAASGSYMASKIYGKPSEVSATVTSS